MHLDVVDEHNRPRELVRVRVLLEDGTEVMLPRAGGQVEIPVSSRARAIELEAPLARVVRLEPSEGAEPRAGRGRLTRRAAAPPRVQVVDPSGTPSGGVRVTLRSPRSIRDGDASALPTGWRLDRPRAWHDITDGEGWAVFAAAEAGESDVRVDFDPGASGDRFGTRLYQFGQRVRVEAEGSVQRVVVSVPRLPGVTVEEATTGLPVRGFEIRDSVSKQIVVVDGCYWKGWVSSTPHPVEVRVPALGVQSITLDGGVDTTEMAVLVRASVLTTVEVEGLPSELRSGPSEWTVFADSKDGLHAIAKFSVSPEGRACRFAPPYEGSLSVGLAHFAGLGAGRRGEPREQPWKVDGRLQLRIVER